MTTIEITAQDLTSTPREIWIGYDAPTADAILDGDDNDARVEFTTRAAAAVNARLAQIDVTYVVGTEDDRRWAAQSEALASYDPEQVAQDTLTALGVTVDSLA